jgi:hypothetical protein
MSTASLLTYTRSQVGYTEHATNDTKFGLQFGLNPALWCMMFVWCCFQNSDNRGLVVKTASTRVLFSAAKRGDLGMMFLPASATPRPGDLVEYDLGGQFKPVNHIGIVEQVFPGGRFTAIEGNASNRVARKNSDSPERRGKVINFVRTRLAGPIPGPGMPESPAFPGIIKRGDVGENVRRIQARLNQIGHGHHSALGGRPLAVDGIFGEDTEKVVKTFQQHRNITVDGIVGPNTHRLMFP